MEILFKIRNNHSIDFIKYFTESCYETTGVDSFLIRSNNFSNIYAIAYNGQCYMTAKTLYLVLINDLDLFLDDPIIKNFKFKMSLSKDDDLYELTEIFDDFEESKVLNIDREISEGQKFMKKYNIRNKINHENKYVFSRKDYNTYGRNTKF